MMVYLASPYSNPDPGVMHLNFIKIAILAADLNSKGIVAISPIVYGHTLLSFHEMPSDWEFWKNFCISILVKCEKMIVYKMDGWDKSRGVQEEIKIAEELSIPIEYLEYSENANSLN